GGKLRADEARRTDCVFAHGGSVFGCNGAKRALGTRPGILWYEVRVSDGALLQEGLVDDPACDYLNPSLAVDRDGNVGLGCTRTRTGASIGSGSRPGLPSGARPSGKPSPAQINRKPLPEKGLQSVAGRPLDRKSLGPNDLWNPCAGPGDHSGSRSAG